MALETGTHISDLNAANPVSTDGLAQADDHCLIKSTIAGVVHLWRNDRNAYCPQWTGRTGHKPQAPLPP